MNAKQRIAIIGGGPAGLFLYKALIKSGLTHIEPSIFEATGQLGAGMPYSAAGANTEHVTNISGHELPELATTMKEWVKTLSVETLRVSGIDPDRFNPRKVVPRLLFGKYLADQFALLRQRADLAGFQTTVYLNSLVTDIADDPASGSVTVEVNGNDVHAFDRVVICTGHNWPARHEGNVRGYFDSPYPPAKLALKLDHAVAVRGSSLTAIDAIRTLARHNGRFVEKNGSVLAYEPDAGSERFTIVMHSRNGLLPAVRIHQEDPFLANTLLLDREEIEAQRNAHGGFVPLDYLFEKKFKARFAEKDPAFHELIKDLDLEGFVETVMTVRESQDPFDLFKREYAQAAVSIRDREPIHWKEALAALSFAMNHPAKYLSAEDMLRLQRVLMPLISVVIAFVPQRSCEELLALHSAGRLQVVAVGPESQVTPNHNGGVTYAYTDSTNHSHSVHYSTFVDCIGQPHLSCMDIPFKSLLKDGSVTAARLRFASAARGREELDNGNDRVIAVIDGGYYLQVPGIAITDRFQLVDRRGVANGRIHIMAVPYIGGYNPDYSGLDFCAETSVTIADCLTRLDGVLETIEAGMDPEPPIMSNAV